MSEVSRQEEGFNLDNTAKTSQIFISQVGFCVLFLTACFSSHKYYIQDGGLL